MARIQKEDAQGWVESTKLPLSSLDIALLTQIEGEVLARLATAYDTSTWLDQTSTPLVVRVIIAKTYVAWIYDRQYSENQTGGNDYAAMLRTNAEMLIVGLVNGTIDIPGVNPTGSIPSFYPNDASSAQDPTPDDTSLGPAAFSMGKVF
jgi:hypothetical protein